MDNERPNERTIWSSRLEEPGALPGMGLTDKEATWDKLYDRLRETPRRRTLPWLWAAAACLLLALVPAAFFLREKRAIPHSNTTKVTVQPNTNRLRTQTPDPEPSIVIQNTMQTPSSRPVTPPHPIRREGPAPVKIPVRALTPIAIQSPARTALPELLLPLHPDLSRPIITASVQAAPKKEPRIVHINELEPLWPAPSAAGQRLKPGRLHIGFNPQQDAFRPATTYETYQADHPIISFKHTTQNP
jgi:hypothetical protein